MAMTEAEFLKSVARKLGRTPLASPPPRPGHRRGLLPPPTGLSGREALADWFSRELERLAGTVETVSDLEAAGAAVARAVGNRSPGGGTVVLWDDPIAAAAERPFEAAGFQVRRWPVERYLCAGAVAGVTSAWRGIAETGTLALIAAPGMGRSVSLLPPLHLAILPTSRLLATAGEFFSLLGTLERMPSALNLVTGPSRTADIEMELCVGVHGPAALHAVLFHD